MLFTELTLNLAESSHERVATISDFLVKLHKFELHRHKAKCSLCKGNCNCIMLLLMANFALNCHKVDKQIYQLTYII